jgi:hypothetical protein
MTLTRLSVFRMVAVGVFSLAATGDAWAQAQDRIVRPIDDARLATLPGTLHPLARPEVDQGAVDPGMRLEGMSLNFKPSAQQQADLEQLLREQQTPTSPDYHHWLTQAEYADRFGMSPADISKVTAWLTGHGFQVLQVAPSRNSIRFSGTAGMVAQAFHTQLHHYFVHGEMHFANAAAIQLPEAFASSVVHVGGLNDFRPKARVKSRHIPAPGESGKATASPEFTSGLTGNTFMAPGDFAVIYDVKPLYTAGYTGTGQQIAVMGQTNIHTDDIAAFRSAAGLSTANLTTYCITETTASQYCSGDSSYAPSSAGDEVESDLDVEWSGAVAQNATINFIFAGYADPDNDVMSALSYAITTYTVNGQVVPIISISYGGCEAGYPDSQLESLRAEVQQANSQGQTVVGPTGDSGAADCENSGATSAVYGLAVDAPASIPEVTAVGGTEFTDESDPSAYWTNGGSSCTNCADVLTSALSYIPGEVWNDTAADGELAAGGGGVSTYFAQPVWQEGLTPPGFTGTPMRFVPDLSLNASDYHDQYLICSQQYSDAGVAEGTWCGNGFRNNGKYGTENDLDVVGGTSCGVPSFAGILSLIEQKEGATSGLGNINPILYGVANNAATYATAFHDITTGNNEVPCYAGATFPDGSVCPNGGLIGYVAGTGYDLASGWGAVDANGLAAAFLSYESPTGAATTTAVVPSATTVYQGTAVTLTATVTSTSTTAGSITGYVVFSVGSTTLATVPLTASATATVNLTAAQTEALAAGSVTVTALYQGDVNYAGSKGTQQITVELMPSVSIAASAMTISSNASGSSGTSTITLNSTNGFAGTVDFSNATLSATPQLNASMALSAKTVSVNSGSSATDTLTVTLTTSGQVRPGTTNRASHRMLPLSGGAIMLVGAWFFLPRQRRRRCAPWVFLLIVALATGLSCGGGSSSNSSAPTPTPTPTTTYTVTLGNIAASDPGTGTQTTVSTSFTLTVQ